MVSIAVMMYTESRQFDQLRSNAPHSDVLFMVHLKLKHVL